jgi:hypothetical protein
LTKRSFDIEVAIFRSDFKRLSAINHFGQIYKILAQGLP